MTHPVFRWVKSRRAGSPWEVARDWGDDCWIPGDYEATPNKELILGPVVEPPPDE